MKSHAITVDDIQSRRTHLLLGSTYERCPFGRATPNLKVKMFRQLSLDTLHTIPVEDCVGKLSGYSRKNRIDRFARKDVDLAKIRPVEPTTVGGEAAAFFDV
jgi:hypothetical protein